VKRIVRGATYSVDRPAKSKALPEISGAASDTKRRRIGLVVHDDRGNASVEWHDAPADYQRPVLEVLGEPKLTIQSEDESCDPYARGAAPAKPNAGSTTRTDLRKLSEWIKMMRELEERKRNGGGDQGED
jgi:hypothetical protein